MRPAFLLVLVGSNLAYADEPAGSNDAPAETADASAPAPAKKDWKNIPIEREENRAHFLGIRANIGSAYELGLGYIHAHESYVKHQFGGMFWFGYGVDARFVLDGDGVAGIIASAVGRTAFVGHGLPSGFEIALGVGNGADETRMVASGAFFISLYYADLGYQYQLALLPFDRPDWLGAHFFAVRGHIPLHRYAHRKWTEPPISQRK